MNDFIRRGETTRAGVVYAEQTRAERLWARCIAIVAHCEPQPWSSLSRVSNPQLTIYLLKQSGMPRWLIGSFTRRDDTEIAAALAAVQEARREPQLADWLDRVAAAMPNFNDAEPNGEPEFREVAV